MLGWLLEEWGGCTEFTGAIVPEFLNAEFRGKIDSIIKQLKEDGIIEE